MSIKKNVWTGPLILLLALSAVMTSWAAGGQMMEHAETGDALTMEVTYGYGNKAKGGRYVPLDLLFENHEQKRFAGSLQVLAMESDYEVYQYDYPLEINEGESLEKHLYIPMGRDAGVSPPSENGFQPGRAGTVCRSLKRYPGTPGGRMGWGGCGSWNAENQSHYL